MRADSESIRKLLHESDVSKYRIWKDTGIAQSTLSDLVNEKVKIKDMRFELAAQLTNYYEEMTDVDNIKIKQIKKWLNEYGTVEKYDQFKKQPALIELAQPIDFVSFWYTTLNEEIENNEFEGTPEELAGFMNLEDTRPDEVFVQLNVIDWGDSTNATAFYLSDIDTKEEFMQYVNQALDLDQVTHSSGLKSRYQFI